MSDFDLKSGLTGTDDAPASTDSFEDGLKAAIGNNDPAAQSSPAPAAPADPALSTGQQIVAGLLDPGTSPNIADGLTVPEDPEPASDSVVLGDGNRYSTAELDAAIDSVVKREESLTEELQLVRDGEAEDTFQADLEDAATEAEDYAEGVVAAVGEQATAYINGEISEEAFADFRARAMDSLTEAYLPTDDNGEYDAQAIEQLGALLDAGMRQYATERRSEDIEQAMPALIGKAAEQRAVEIKAVLTQWSRDQGITDAPTREMRLRNAEAAYLDATGHELGDLWSRIDVTPDQMYEALAEADARVATALHEQRDLAFKQQMLSSGAGALSEGLEIDGRRVVQHVLPEPTPDKLNRRVEAFKRRQRYADPHTVKANFADPVKMKDGWTKGRKQVKQSDVDGSREAYLAEEKRRREEARSF